MNSLKAVVAIIVSAAGALITALGPPGNTIGDLDAKHWLIAIATVLGSGGLVWFAENGPAAPAIKAVLAFLSAGIASLVVALDDNHITQAEWLIAFVAAITATGLVYQVTNSGRATTSG
jgi:hypothetical protein